MVYASSAAIYGDQGAGAIGEAATPRPQSAYGADKLGCELHAAVAAGVHGVPTTGFRFFNVFGPRQDPKSPYSGVISIFAERIAADRPITIHGDGLQTRDFIFVQDIVRFLLAGMRRRANMAGADVFNACTGRALSVLDLARTLGEVSGRTPRIGFGPARAGDIRVSLGDPGRAAAALGVLATVSLADGLRVTLGSLADP